MHSLVALLFPRMCLLCGDRAEDPHNLCGGCIRDLPEIGNCCRRCALPLPVRGTDVCAQCASAPPPFRRAVAALRYVQPVDTLIRQLKFEGNLAVAPTLGWLLAHRVAEEEDASAPECIVPVPLHPRRLRARGFNQSLEIARALGAATGVPVKRDWTRRTRDTPGSVPDSERPRPGNQRSGRVFRLPPACTLPTRRNPGRCGHHRSDRLGAGPGCPRRRRGARGLVVRRTSRARRNCARRRLTQVSRLATASAFDSMKSRRGPT